MRNFLLITLALAMLDGSAGLAQPRRAASPRNQPASAMAAGVTVPLTPGVLGAMPGFGGPVPGTIPTPIAGALGTIPGMIGTGATVAAGPIGAITTCARATGFALDASSATAISGALATPPLPGATVPPSPSFGSSIANGGCNPANATQNALEALGVAAVIAPIPGLATITAPTYSDATVPSAMTEAGGSGLSPLIVVPSPLVVSPCGTTTLMMGGMTVPTTDPTMTAPTTLSMTSSNMTTGSLDMAMTQGIPGC
jgi:hypothetical protein